MIISALHILERGNIVICQLPDAQEFTPGEHWPQPLEQLFEEACKSYAAGAYTAAAMVCRKILMSCACEEGAEEGKKFAEYVDYIVGNVLTIPRAKDPVEKIRNIGNDANHKIQFVSRDQAKRAMSIIHYMLTAVYSLPAS